MKIPIKFLSAVLAPFVLPLSGCMSVGWTFGDLGESATKKEERNNKIYIGTRQDLNNLGRAFEGSSTSGYYAILLPFYLIDLPFTLVGDTLFLVYTVPHTISRSTDKATP